METFSALLAICAGNSPVPGEFPHKGQWRGALMFSLICVWINGWVNNRKAGDLRRYRIHHDVIVMPWWCLDFILCHHVITYMYHLIESMWYHRLFIWLDSFWIGCILTAYCKIKYLNRVLFVHINSAHKRWILCDLTHWGRVKHMCVSKISIIVSDNGLWTQSHYLNQCLNIVNWTPGRLNFREILNEINTVSFKKMHLNMSSAQWRFFPLSLNEVIARPCPKFNGALVKAPQYFEHVTNNYVSG